MNEKPENAPEGSKLDKNGVWRNAQGHILPGQVLNPNGRTKDERTKKFHDAAKGYSMDALKVVYNIMMDRKAQYQDRLRAANLIMDRGYGRPKPQEEELTGQYQPQQIIIGDISNLVKLDQEITESGKQLETDADE